MATRNKISAVIITKNEESNIGRCLKSLHWVDEIVVVDSGSTDRTVEICKMYNCKIVETKWLGYGKTKQLAVNSSSNNWILSIDSDEQVSENSVNVIKTLLKNPTYKAYKVQIKSFYLGRMINHSGWGNEFKLRIFNKEFGNYNDSEIHESVMIDGEKPNLKVEFYHYTYPSLEVNMRKLDRYSSLQAKELSEKGKKYSLGLIPIFVLNKFLSMYLLKLGFLDGKEGFILASMSSFGVFLKYTKLWKLNKK
jgi:glycosyltransferase involved in cell wall biosynthesis